MVEKEVFSEGSRNKEIIYSLLFVAIRSIYLTISVSYIVSDGAAGSPYRFPVTQAPAYVDGAVVTAVLLEQRGGGYEDSPELGGFSQDQERSGEGRVKPGSRRHSLQVPG
jgi:hypothetical protein